MLLLCLCIYLGKEFITMRISRCQGYFKRLATYRNIVIIISIALVTYNGPTVYDDHKFSLSFLRWQYHVASFTCLLVWLEMAVLFSKIPLFGKYFHMFK